jgi:hypothetical protein
MPLFTTSSDARIKYADYGPLGKSKFFEISLNLTEFWIPGDKFFMDPLTRYTLSLLASNSPWLVSLLVVAVVLKHIGPIHISLNGVSFSIGHDNAKSNKR